MRFCVSASARCQHSGRQGGVRQQGGAQVDHPRSSSPCRSSPGSRSSAPSTSRTTSASTRSASAEVACSAPSPSIGMALEERSPLRRDARGPRAPERDRRRPEGHQRLADRHATGLRCRRVQCAARLSGARPRCVASDRGLAARGAQLRARAGRVSGAELMPVDRDSLVGRAVLDGKAQQVADIASSTPFPTRKRTRASSRIAPSHRRL